MPKLNKIEEQFSKKSVERRFFSESEFRVSDDGKKIVGYAAKFDELSPLYWGFREKIRKGAFTKTIKEADIRALFNHDPNFVLGRNKAGTLTLKEDDLGLKYEITPPNTTTATDLKESIKRGDISQSSFAFKTVKDLWDDDDEKGLTRELIEVKLFDVSPVTYPWYPTTEAGLRSQVENTGSEIRNICLKLINNVELEAEEREKINNHINNQEPLKKHSTKKEEPLEEHSKSIATEEVLRKKIDLFEFESEK